MFLRRISINLTDWNNLIEENLLAKTCLSSPPLPSKSATPPTTTPLPKCSTPSQKEKDSETTNKMRNLFSIPAIAPITIFPSKSLTEPLPSDMEPSTISPKSISILTSACPKPLPRHLISPNPHSSKIKTTKRDLALETVAKTWSSLALSPKLSTTKTLAQEPMKSPPPKVDASIVSKEKENKPNPKIPPAQEIVIHFLLKTK